MTTETAKRTEKSWTYHHASIWWEGLPVAHMDRGPEHGNEPVEMDANGAFIVRACNSHAELLEALKMLHGDVKLPNMRLEGQGHLSIVEDENGKVFNSIRWARRIIAKAEGTE